MSRVARIGNVTSLDAYRADRQAGHAAAHEITRLRASAAKAARRGDLAGHRFFSSLIDQRVGMAQEASFPTDDGHGGEAA